jgi:hypothetical protein
MNPGLARCYDKVAAQRRPRSVQWYLSRLANELVEAVFPEADPAFFELLVCVCSHKRPVEGRQIFEGLGSGNTPSAGF